MADRKCDMSETDFIEMLVAAGWGQKEAQEEYEWLMGPEGDVDGDLEG